MPSRSRTSPKRIVLLQSKDSGYCREVMSGVLAHIEVRGLSWCLQSAPPVKRVLPALVDWKPHAVIAHLVDEGFARNLLAQKIPVVSTSYALADLSVATYDVDHIGVGRMAARYFMGRGFQHFGYFGSEHSLFSIEREEGFADELAANGFPCDTHHAEVLPIPEPTIGWARLDRMVERWLRALPKPVAILASNDSPARKLLELCHRLEMPVPTDVAVLGVDNDEAECRMATPTLSSIALPAAKVGELAATAVEGLLAGRKLAPVFTRLDPLHVVTRESTDMDAAEDAIIRKAMHAIRENLLEGITVESVARSAGCSRRALERRFREKLHGSVLGHIHAAHIDVAKRLLVETDLPISLVAERCGIQEVRRFNNLFRKFCRTTPRDYRSNARPAG